MITHFLGKEEVIGFCRDFVTRLECIGYTSFALCPIGVSGDQLTQIIGLLLDENPSNKNILLFPAYYNKSTKSVTFGESPETQIKDTLAKVDAVFIIDSSVHSGASMLQVSTRLQQLGAKQVVTYSLIVKQGSKHIPHFFGLIIGEHERVFFLLDRIPNNRLFDPRRRPLGILRSLIDHDGERTGTLNTTESSINSTSWGDLWYAKNAHGHEVYVIEDNGVLASCISLKFEGLRLLVDLVATDTKYKDRGLGGALIRLAENLARARSCTHIQLWAISNRISWYEGFGFIQGGEALKIDGQEYVAMQRKLLYNFDLPNLLA